jgi:hypothetical protein
MRKFKIPVLFLLLFVISYLAFVLYRVLATNKPANGGLQCAKICRHLQNLALDPPGH